MPTRARSTSPARAASSARSSSTSPTTGAIEVRPQPGPQEKFLASAADIAIYGGAAGGGKTWALLIECLRHVGNPRFGAVIFRRTSPQITNEGGLWDESMALYPLAGATPRLGTLDWSFPGGANVGFRHMQYEATKLEWQGAQVPLIGFDELTHFTEGQFFYLLSRNRSTCGVRPYVRATTNPDAHSWVKPLLGPWVDRKHPLYPTPSGTILWFVRDGGLIRWVGPDEPDAKSLTFVRASVHDNRVLLAKDPGYLANLKALSAVDRARLLDGDWDAVADGSMFRRAWFGEPGPVPPSDGLTLCRFWDLAATEAKAGRDPDWTAGVLLGRDGDGRYHVLDVQRVRDTPGVVEALVRQTAAVDRARFGHVQVRMEQEPGSSGVSVIDHYARSVLPGYEFRGQRSTGPKIERAKPLSSMAEAGHVRLVAGPWAHDLLNELVAFPTEGVHDDQVDALSGAFNVLAPGGAWTGGSLSDY